MKNQDNYLETIDMITKEVANYYNFDSNKLHEKTKKTDIVIYRQIVLYLVNTNTQISKTEMGKYFGVKHSTAISSITRMKLLIDNIPSLAREISDLNHILELKGISTRKYGFRNWMHFFDLDNFVSVRSGDKFVLVKGYSLNEVKDEMATIFPDQNWVVSEHKNTGHSFFGRKQNEETRKPE